ncbi:GyrI-like domain-containing protein [Marivirga tractuosa]|uniref:GyrI-like domain-containing protein n=1 Tax=Marivirga tractuosa TaxID=1006 RepID=UPI0035CE867E
MTYKQIIISVFAIVSFACNPKTEDMADNVKIENFKIIGISINTTNQQGKAMSDMGQLWDNFYSQNILSAIPNKTSDDVYSLYTDYESDFKGGYTAIIGCRVNSLDSIPEGLIGREFKGGQFEKYIAKGKMPDAVINKWQKIWDKDSEINRKYTVDFEVYGEKSQNPENPEVEIYIAVD